MISLNTILHQEAATRVLAGDQSIYQYPNIPKNKLAGALSAYVIDKDIKANDIVLLLDDTLFGSAKDGLVLTEHTLYVHEAFSDPIAYDFSDMSAIAWKSELLSKVLYIDGERVIALSQCSKDSLTALCMVINTYLKQYKAQRTSQTNPSRQKADSSSDNTRQTSNNHTEQSSQASSAHFRPDSNNEDLLTFELSMITADILMHFCLSDGKQWSDEKLVFIYQATRYLHERPYLFSLLKHRLRVGERPALQDSVAYLMQHEPPEEVKLQLMRQAFQILALDETDLMAVERQIRQFALLLNVFPASLDQFCQQLRQQFNYGNTQNSNRQDRHNDHSSSSQQHNTLGWACQLLEINQQQLTQAVVQQAYRSKIQEFHPDKYQSLPASVRQLLESKAQELNQARDILTAYVQ
jgi:hypothetical protein